MVTAFLRWPKAFHLRHPNLTIIPGNVLNAEVVTVIVFGKDIVLSALDTRKRRPLDLVVGTHNILTAIYQCDVPRSFWFSAFGAGESLMQLGWLARWVILEGFLRRTIAASEAQERLIRESDGDWIIVRPGSLTDGPRTGVYRVLRSDAAVKIRRPSISRADVADFMLRHLTDDEYLHQAVGLTY